jgi:hypothetical protein
MPRCRRHPSAIVRSPFTIQILVAGVLLLAGACSASGEIVFEDRTAQSNFAVLIGSNEWHASAWGDVNGNGYPDLFTGFFKTTYTGVGNANKLLLNQGDGTFVESRQPAINLQGMRVSGAAFADFDDSGSLDLVITQHGTTNTSRIFANDGSGQFTDRTAGSNLGFVSFAARTPFIADFTGDGKLDILLQHDIYNGKVYQSRMMRNEGGFQFTDITAQAGLPVAGSGDELLGLGGAVADFNGDGAPDFIFAGPKRSAPRNTMNRMFLGHAGGTFAEYMHNAVFNNPAHWPTLSNDDWPVGAAAGDLNNDGRMDLIIGQHFASTLDPPALPLAVQVYINLGTDANGQPLFTNMTAALGVPAFNSRIPHVDIRDMDNDGFADIILSMALAHAGHGGAQHPVVLRNRLGETGQLGFVMPAGQNPGDFSGPYISPIRWFTDPSINPKYWPGAPVADYDRDGRLDLMGQEAIHPNQRDSPLFRNVTDNDNRFVQIRVDVSGVAGVNINGIGSSVKIYETGRAGDRSALLVTAEIQITNGYSSGVEAVAHFGVGRRKRVDVVVVLPWGARVWTVKRLPTNSFYTVSGDAVMQEPGTVLWLASAGKGFTGNL